jgi:hypothetical protein
LHAVERIAAAAQTAAATATRLDEARRESGDWRDEAERVVVATDDLTGQLLGHLQKPSILQAFTAGNRYPDRTPVPVSQLIG